MGEPLLRHSLGRVCLLLQVRGSLMDPEPTNSSISEVVRHRPSHLLQRRQMFSMFLLFKSKQTFQPRHFQAQLLLMKAMFLDPTSSNMSEESPKLSMCHYSGLGLPALFQVLLCSMRTMSQDPTSRSMSEEEILEFKHFQAPLCLMRDMCLALTSSNMSGSGLLSQLEMPRP